MRFRAEHKFARENLSAFMDRELDMRAAGRVTRHLEACEACRQELAALRHTVALVKAMPRLAVPRSFVLPAAAQPAQRTLRRWQQTYAFAKAGTLVASLLLVLAMGGDALFRTGALVIPVAYAPQPAAMVRDASQAPVAENGGAEQSLGAPAELVSALAPVSEPAEEVTSSEGFGAGEGEVAKALVAPTEAESNGEPVIEAVVMEPEVAADAGEGHPTTTVPMARTTGAGPTRSVSAVDAEVVPSPEPPQAKGGGGLPPTPTVEEPTPAPTAEPTQVLTVAPTMAPSPQPEVVVMAVEQPDVLDPTPAVLAESPASASRWGLWRATRFMAYAALALLCFCLAALVWSGHKRRL